ncbi:MAG: aminopeptidase P family protein [Candidatus Spyradocola sp.]|jgi:Xaa-Pro aminopeptidase
MNRLQKIAEVVRTLDLDALLLTHEENMQYATLFPHLEGMVLVLRSGEGVCFTDSRYIENATQVMAPQGWRVIEPEGSYPTVGTIRDFVAEKGIRTLGFEDEKMTVAEYESYRAALPCALRPLGDALSRLRQVKEDREIEWLRQAQAIAEKALFALLPDIRPGAYEDELAAKLTYLMNLGGSEGAVLPIFVSGKKSSMPHGRPSHKAIEAGDFVTIDMGAIVAGYMSDMTRTFAVGYATDEMRQVYQVVLDAQAAGIAAFAEGMRGCDVDKAARDVIEAAGYGAYFGHGLGHSLGLNIHEDPRASRTYTGTFPARSIVTIEPGIYLPGRFGVRIEDMVWLAPEGKEDLTHFPKELMVLS